jgi:hypothetical protein
MEWTRQVKTSCTVCLHTQRPLLRAARPCAAHPEPAGSCVAAALVAQLPDATLVGASACSTHGVTGRLVLLPTLPLRTCSMAQVGLQCWIAMSAGSSWLHFGQRRLVCSTPSTQDWQKLCWQGSARGQRLPVVLYDPGTLRAPWPAHAAAATCIEVRCCVVAVVMAAQKGEPQGRPLPRCQQVHRPVQFTAAIKRHPPHSMSSLLNHIQPHNK